MKKPLSATNPYLQKPELKKEMVERFVASSSAIEGIHISQHKKTTSSKKHSSTRDRA